MVEDDIALDLIHRMERVRLNLEDLKEGENKFDKRKIAIAVTNLETAMLWAADSRPETEFRIS